MINNFYFSVFKMKKLFLVVFILFFFVGSSGYSQVGIKAASHPNLPSASMEVYFTRSVDQTKSTGRLANGSQNINTRLVERINLARFSVDMCIYNLRETTVATALVNAKNQRGVKVRVITEYENRSGNQAITTLVNAGIPVLDDSAGPNNQEDQRMHNKFTIFDARDSSSLKDDWVWTGSFNFTSESVSKNAENVIIVRDPNLASAYTTEFNEMWGGSGDQPVPENSKFGKNKQNNIPHIFSVGGGYNNCELYMSPSDSPENELISAIQSANYEIYFCIYSFTLQNITSLLIQKLYAGVDIKGIFDSSCVYDPQYCQYDELLARGADVYEDGVASGGLLHHKYIIVDGMHPDSDPVILTGSMNWSTSGIDFNDENLLEIKDDIIANLYVQEFYKRLQEAGGD
jgi:phosphatidylserine/phosphatidylglycerophosphate/cardiolipin synthase-like enzyme